METQYFDLRDTRRPGNETEHIIAQAAEILRRGGLLAIPTETVYGLGANGLDAAAALKAAFPQVKIIAITSMAASSWLKRAREIGIESFWYKEVSQETILEVMDRTMAGEFVYPDHPPTVHLGLSSNTEFTTRELEVLRVMTKGLSNSAIAQKLGISENTVKVHIQHMLDKTGYKNRTELAIEARVSGVAISID